MALKNWRVRSRLLLLITIPTLTAVILGGTRIVSSVQNALTYQRIGQLANLSSAVTGLAAKLEDERDWTVVYIADGSIGRAADLAGTKAGKSAAAPQLQLVHEQYSFTAPWIAQVRRQLGNIGSGYPVQVQQDAAAIRAQLAGLPDLRYAAVNTYLPSLVVVSKYTSTINSLLAIDDDIALDSGDPVLASDVRALGITSRIAEEASEQRAILAYALTQQKFGPGVLTALQTAQAEMNDNVSEFDNAGTVQQTALYQNKVSGALVDLADQYEQQALAFGQGGKPLTTSATTTEEWFGAMSGKIDAMRQVEQTLVGDSVTRASTLRRDAIIYGGGIGAAIILVLLLALLLTTMVGRSMVRPLRRLRAGALEIAGLQLPETVRRMSESDGSGVPLTVAPIDVDSADEIGEVARAFDQVHREAIRLAANEAALRGNVNAMFVNLSRRSQSLVERQIRLIDDLEQGEQDAERLSSLFQMDHLATRMRRNSENLLVLAGHDSSRRWNQPVALVDVLRAAVSEIEQYERVSLNVQPGISVRGHAVNDVVHLLAELAENATSFSSAETPVTISGHLLSSGGVLLDITDQGVGMGGEEMAHANWRLDNPPVVDVAVSRRMGLFVVARLAARHGVRVRLRPAASGGLTALVWLPDEVISREGAASPTGSRFPDSAADAIGLAGLGEFSTDIPADERAATAQEVTAARTPRFAPLDPAAGDKGGLGPRRVPGVGPRPGAGRATTGPLPAFRGGPGDDDDLDIPRPPAAGSFIGGDGSGWSSPSGGQPPTGATQPGMVQPPSGPPPAAPQGGNGRQLPKRRVGDQAGDGAERSGGGSDLFSPRSGLSSASDLFSTSRPAAPGSAPGQSAPPPEPQPGDAPTGSLPVFNAPVGTDYAASAGADSTAGPGVGSNGGAGFGWDNGGGSDDGVVVPPAEQTSEYRLPIFEAVESDWFRRGRSSVGWSPQDDGPPPARSGWSSPADEGWQAAAALSSPSSAGTTTAGLPKRVPQANLVPGSAAAEPAAAAPATPARSAAATRERFASFQRGIREGRAAIGSDGPGGEDDGSR
jgi:signal transduction histidine kinase